MSFQVTPSAQTITVSQSNGFSNILQLSGGNPPYTDLFILRGSPPLYLIPNTLVSNNFSQLKVSTDESSFDSTLAPGQYEIVFNVTYVNSESPSAYISYTLTVIADPIICFKENTKILTNKGYQLIQNLKKGDLVKTLKYGFK